MLAPNVNVIDEKIKNIIERHNKYSFLHYKQLPIVAKRAKGLYIYDPNERKYLDMLCTYASSLLGHCPAEMQGLMARLYKDDKFCNLSNNFYTEEYADLVEKLSTMLPPLDNKFDSNNNAVLLKVGGAGINDPADMWACKLGNMGWLNQGIIKDGCQEIIVFILGFCGRTKAAISASSNPLHYEGYCSQLNNYSKVIFNDLEAVRSAITPNTVAIKAEPIQGEGGMRVPDPDYLTELRKIANEFNILLIYDEIQTGFGRTGEMFAFYHEKDAEPDGIMLSKALGAGVFPISALVAGEVTRAAFPVNTMGETYSGGQIATAIALKTIQLIEEYDLPANAKKMGNILMEGLQYIYKKHDIVLDVRGKGLMIGVELDKNKNPNIGRQMSLDMLDRDVVMVPTQSNVMRITPALIINDNQVNFFLEQFDDAISQY